MSFKTHWVPIFSLFPVPVSPFKPHEFFGPHYCTGKKPFEPRLVLLNYFEFWDPVNPNQYCGAYFLQMKNISDSLSPNLFTVPSPCEPFKAPWILLSSFLHWKNSSEPRLALVNSFAFWVPVKNPYKYCGAHFFYIYEKYLSPTDSVPIFSLFSVPVSTYKANFLHWKNGAPPNWDYFWWADAQAVLSPGKW